MVGLDGVQRSKHAPTELVVAGGVNGTGNGHCSARLQCHSVYGITQLTYGTSSCPVKKIDCLFCCRILVLYPQSKLYSPDQLNELMAASDYIVMATPHTASTHKMVSEAAIAAMKPNGVFINVGRGKCVDEQALIKGKWQGSTMENFQACHNCHRYPAHMGEPQSDYARSPAVTTSSITRSSHTIRNTSM